MADTVTLSGSGATPPANTVIATDDAGASGQVQIVKLAQSADGSASPIPADGDGMHVKITSVASALAVTDNGSTLSVDDGGSTVSVDDGGGALTVDGTVTANVGTTGGLALDDTLTGGTAKAIARGAAKGATSAADATVTAVDADHNALDAYIRGALPDGSSSGTYDGANDALTLALEGRDGAHISWDAHDLDGTLVPEVCYETSATNWLSAHFMHPVTGDVETSFAGGGSGSASSKLIVWPGSAKHVRVRCSSYTSGSLVATLHTTEKAPNILLGHDGTNLRAPKVVNTAPAGTDYGLVVRVAGAGASGTSTADGTAFVVDTTAGTIAQGLYEAAPTSLTSGDVGALGATVKRALKMAAYTPDGDSMADDTNNCLNVSPITTVTIGGHSATSTTTEFTTCTSQANLRMTTATTTEIIAAVASKLPRICGIILLADGDTDVTFVEGTGADCITGQGTLLGPLDLTSTNGRGFTVGFGPNVVLDGAAVSNAICVTSSAAVNLTVFVRYANY